MDTIVPPTKNENPQRPPYRHPTLQRNDGLYNASRTTIFGDNSLIGSSSSSLDTIRPPINHENPQLLPYPSSTTIHWQSNGSLCHASFMTSPSCDSFIKVPDYIAEVPQVQSSFSELEDSEEVPNMFPTNLRLQAPPTLDSPSVPALGLLDVLSRMRASAQEKLGDMRLDEVRNWAQKNVDWIETYHLKIARDYVLRCVPSPKAYLCYI